MIWVECRGDLDYIGIKRYEFYQLWNAIIVMNDQRFKERYIINLLVQKEQS